VNLAAEPARDREVPRLRARLVFERLGHGRALVVARLLERDGLARETEKDRAPRLGELDTFGQLGRRRLAIELLRELARRARVTAAHHLDQVDRGRGSSAPGPRARA
jgi:hypothetical protein